SIALAAPVLTRRGTARAAQATSTVASLGETVAAYRPPAADYCLVYHYYWETASTKAFQCRMSLRIVHTMYKNFGSNAFAVVLVTFKPHYLGACCRIRNAFSSPSHCGRTSPAYRPACCRAGSS